jgi:Glycosyl hydrolase family 3 N terminal domain
MAHRSHPILRGLALSLALLTPPATLAAPDGGRPEYSSLAGSGLAPRDSSPAAPEGGAVLTAQNWDPPEDDEIAARAKLKAELDRIRRESLSGGNPSSFDPPMPVRKKAGSPATPVAEAGAQPVRQVSGAGGPQIDRLTGQLLVMAFKGSQPSDPGPKGIHFLLQSGLIAGALFSRENIQSKVQLKELMKFLWPGGAQNRPVFAVREIGGASDALPPIKDFEQWPAERDVAAKGDPQYAYSTYRSLGSALAGLGFNINFGPVLAPAGNVRDQSSSFGSNPLQTGVFAKTFILGHREENITAVPVVDGSDHSIRALKTLLVSDSGIPVAANANAGGDAGPFSAYDGLLRGVKFCFLAAPRGGEGQGAVNGFVRGCDVLVLESATENPAAARDEIALALTQATQTGELTLDALAASAQRLGELRSPAGNGGPTAARSQ